MEMLLNKLLICSLTLFVIILPQRSVQDSYTTVSADSIQLNGILLDDSEQIIERLLSKKFSKKTYTPPPGDSDEYDKIHYCEDDNLKLVLYERNSTLRVSTIIIKTEKVVVKIGENTFQIGQDENVLAAFVRSFAALRNNQRVRPSHESEFHLELVRNKGKDRGLITCFIRQNVIIEVAFSFDPA